MGKYFVKSAIVFNALCHDSLKPPFILSCNDGLKESREIDMSCSSYRDSYAVMRFFNFNPGVVDTITYNQELADQMLHFELGLSGGSLIRIVADCDDRPGYFVAASSNRETVLAQEVQLLEELLVWMGTEILSSAD